MTPATAAYRLAVSVLLGAALGLGYGFLRPLRRRAAWISDTLFLLVALWVWVYFSFGVCGGDLRLGYLIGMAAGGMAWEGTFGVPLRPVFSGFWKKVCWVMALPVLPVKKFTQIAKILFASGEKWVTIRWNHHKQHRATPGGRTHERKHKEKRQGRVSADSSGTENSLDPVDPVFDRNKTIRSLFFDDLFQQLFLTLLYQKIGINKLKSQLLRKDHPNGTFSDSRHTD